MAVPFWDIFGCTTARDPESPNGFGIQPFPNFPSFRSGPEVPFLLQTLETIAVDTSLPEVFYNPDVSHYNMTGQKCLYMFYNKSNTNTCLNNCSRGPPATEGVRNVADSFSQTMFLYGFTVKIYKNMDYEKIIDVISRVSQQDHTRTSCVWVAMMCQATGNGLHAADRSYEISKIVYLLQSQNLAGIPKVLTVPSLRGGYEMPGLCAWLPQPPQEGSVSCLPCDVMMNMWHGCFDLMHGCFGQDERPKCPVCAARNSDNGNTVRLASGDTKVLPKTSDFFIMHAPKNDLKSICSLMRAIDEVFEEVEVEVEPGDLIPMINQKVANYTDPGEVTVIPETRITLTKTLRFTRTVPHRN